MNDQTSPTADGQLPDPMADPFAAPRGADGLGQVPLPSSPETLSSGGTLASVRRLLQPWRPDITAALTLVGAGAVVGVLTGMAWYRFAPTVPLSLPASAVSQVTGGVDQSSLLVAPEAKGLVSVDGYYFVICALGGLLLGALAFLLARRGEVRDGEQQGAGGAGLGSWAGVLLGGFLASTVAAALGRWISLPDPLTVLRAIAAGHDFHAPVALHSTGLYVVTPLFGMVLYLALASAFTKAPRQEWERFVDRGGYFSQDNPYGFAAPSASAPAPAPAPAPATPPASAPSAPSDSS